MGIPKKGTQQTIRHGKPIRAVTIPIKHAQKQQECCRRYPYLVFCSAATQTPTSAPCPTGLWKNTRETSFYLSSRPINADQAGQAIRDHWRIENSNHHLRDVTLDEDRSRIRTNPGIFASLRSFAANIRHFNQKRSISQDRYANALGGISHIARLACK